MSKASMIKDNKVNPGAAAGRQRFGSMGLRMINGFKNNLGL